MALNYLDKAAWDAGVYKDKGNDDDTQQDTSSEDSGYSASGILSAAKNFLEHPFQGMGTVIAPNYTPRPLDDSVYSDIPGTPVASGQFGELEDESVRDERMKDSADYMAANWPRLYGGAVGAAEGFANVVGGIQNAVGGGNGILTNVQRAEEGMQDYRDQWNNTYGDSYFLNPNKFATDAGSVIGSSVPIMALSALMPGAAVASGTRALTSALSRAGLGRLAMSKAGQALIADTVRSMPTSNLADSLSEYGIVVNDMMQNGMSEDEARRRAIPMFFKNMALDTFTVPLELGVMKGGKGIATGLLGRSAGEGVAKSIAKGAARTGLLAGASGLTEGYQEGAQNALENDVEGNRDGGWYNPFTWTKEDWEAARGGFVGGALMGVPGNVAAGFHPEARQAPLSAESREQAQSIKDTLSHGKPKGMSNAAYNAYIELANSGNPDLIKQAASSLESFQKSQGNSSSESTDDAATEAYKDYEAYDQKQEIENFLNNNTVEQIGGEDNYNWLVGVLRNGTPEEVQKAYNDVIAAEKATAEQEAKNRPARSGGSVSPNTGNTMVNAVIQAANDSGVDPRLALAIAARESGGDDINAIHMPDPHDGIYGIMQAQDETVADLGLDSQYPDWKTDPYQNAMVGMAILKSKIANEDGDVWAGVRDYNGAGEEAEQYRQLVKNNYDNMGDIGGGGGGNATYDGLQLTLPDSDEFTDQSGNVSGLTEDTRMKLRVLDNLCYQKFGQHLIVSSSYREGDPNNHGAGVAFDVSGSIVDDPDARQWLEQAGPAVGLFVIPEYQGEAGAEFAHGDNVHFSNVEPGIYGQTRNAEGHWSEEHAAPSIQSILKGGASSGVSSKAAGDNGQFERELDQAAQEAKSDMDKIQAQSDQAMNEIMNDDSAEKTAQEAQEDAENAQKQATESQQSTQDTVIPDVAQTIRDTSNNIDEINTLDDMFTKDSNGNDKFIDTPENRDFIKANYKDEITKAVNDAMSKKKAPIATPVPKNKQQTPHARLGRILATYDRKDPKFKEYMNTFRNGTEQEQRKLADDLQTMQELERANSLKGNPLASQQGQNTPQNVPQRAVEAPKQPEQVNTHTQVKESLETQKKRNAYLSKKQKLMERVPSGRTVKVHASTNDAGFDATYKIVPAGDITASHDMNYAVNDLYPAEYQPRDRNRPQMRGQVEKMTKGMKPELLAESQFVNEGAPVVNNSGVVLNGNGRVMAVQKAYKGLTDAHKKSAKAYKDYLVSIAPSLGIAPEKVQSMDHPVLVRQAADDADTSAIINSTEGGAKLGGAEQAKADADRLKLSTLERFVDNGTGEFMNPSNREFRRAAASDVFSDAEGNSVFNDKGDLSPTGAFRIRNAIFAKAYNDNYLLTQLSEATDNNSKNIMNAMIAAAPEVAKVNEGIKEGNLYPDYDISDVITKTAKTIMSLRNEGKPLSFHLQETSLFSQGESEAERLVLEFIERNKFKSRTIADMYKGACDRIFAVGSPKQSKLFDSTEAPRISLENIISNAIQEVEHGQSLFDTAEEKPAEKAVSEVPDNRQAEPAGSGRVHQQEAGRVQSQEKEGNEVDEKSKQSDHVDTESQQAESKDKESTHAEEGSQSDVQEEVEKKKEETPAKEEKSNAVSDEDDYHGFLDGKKEVVQKMIRSSLGITHNPLEPGHALHSLKQSIEIKANDGNEHKIEVRDGKTYIDGNKVPKAAAEYYQYLRKQAKQKEQEVPKVQASHLEPFRKVIDGISHKLQTKELTPKQTQDKLKQVLMDAAHATYGTFDDMSLVKTDQQLTSEERTKVNSMVNDAMAVANKMSVEASRKRAEKKAQKESPEKFLKDHVIVTTIPESAAKKETPTREEADAASKEYNKRIDDLLDQYNHGKLTKDEVNAELDKIGKEERADKRLDSTPHNWRHQDVETAIEDMKQDIAHADKRRKEIIANGGELPNGWKLKETPEKPIAETAPKVDNEEKAKEGVGNDGQEQGKSADADGRLESVGAETGEGNDSGKTGKIPRHDGQEAEGIRTSGNQSDSEGHAAGTVPARTGMGKDDSAGTGERGNKQSIPLTPAQAKPSAEETPGHDYTIGNKSQPKDEKSRYKQNVKAIKLLKQLEAEDRMPTPTEQKVLGEYNGWGGLKDAFKEGTPENKELRELLTDEEYKAAQASSLDAFYTPAPIVKAIWKGVKHLGFTHGRVLDPSMGTGNFFGNMPQSMRKDSQLYGVEMDNLTARFAKMLYPSAAVENAPFQRAVVGDNYFDLVISNIPFSQVKVQGYQIHNFFFANGIDKVRPGGLMVFITSQGSLTGRTDAARMRHYLAGEADLIGAFKLPSGTFTDAGTDVATDVVVFRKRDKDKQPSKYANSFVEIESGGLNMYNQYAVNEYFKKHEDNILGDYGTGRDQFGNTVMKVTKKADTDVAELLEKGFNRLPKDVYQPINRSNEPRFNPQIVNKKAVKEKTYRDGEYHIENGEIYQYQYDKDVKLDIAKTGKVAQRIKGYIAIKKDLNALYTAQRDVKATDKQLAILRKKLNKDYDAFVKKNGYLNDPLVTRAFIQDPDAGMVLALERNLQFAKKGNKKVLSHADKADVFTMRTMNPKVQITKADKPDDALIASLQNKGYVDMDYMSQLLGGEKPEVIAKALGSKIFKDPVTEDYVARDEYLSGNVREKYSQAVTAAVKDSTYQRNVDELKKVIPKDLVPEEIMVNLGSPWVPPSDVQAFVDSITNRGLDVEYYPTLAKWTVSGWDSSAQYRANGIEFSKLLEAVLNNKAITIYKGAKKDNVVDREATDAANATADRLREDFRRWLWSDKDRAKRLARYYNDNFNNTVLREYDGSHLTFPWINPKITLRPHQKDAVWRMLTSGNTLVAHCVGAGKTWEMQAAGMEMRRLGIANKPLYCVPNNVVKQFADEFRQLCPEAKLLVIKSGDDLPAVKKMTVEEKTEDGRKKKRKLRRDELTKEEQKKLDESRAARNRALARIQTEDWDGIIMSHTMFERLPVSPETKAKYIQQQLDILEQTVKEAKDGNMSKRDKSNLEARKETLKEKLNEALDDDIKDIGIPFEELGIDQIFVDEADLFKNLHYETSIGGVSGLTNSDANRSQDMFLKTQWLTETRNGRGVVFATGTPISNTIAELYTMSRYLVPKMLKEHGINLFDSWIRTFAEIGTGIERKPSGDGFRKVNRVKNFINMAELTTMFRSFADIKTQDELHLNIPKLKNGKPTTIALDADPAIVNYIKTEVPKRIANIKANAFKMKKGADNMLSLTNDLRHMTMTDAKINACADNIADVFNKTTDVKGAQLVFCDYGIPKAENEKAKNNDTEDDAADDAEKENGEVYARLMQALRERGIPSDQIAFVQSAKNKDQQRELFEKVDNGEIRILIGSTSKMGAGTNCQHHLVALHDLDAPWRPRDLEQRHGRILRQGNLNDEVEIFNYVIKDSFDANMWEKLKNKASIIAQAMSKNTGVRVVEDADMVTLSYADVENAATGNPLIKKRLTMKGELTKLTNASRQFAYQVRDAEYDMESLPKKIEAAEHRVELIESDIKALKDTSGDNFVMKIMGHTYTKRKDAMAALEKAAKKFKNTPTTIGEIGGLRINGWIPVSGVAKYQLVGNFSYDVLTGSVAGMENTLRALPRVLTDEKEHVDKLKARLSDDKKIVEQKNPYTEKLAKVTSELAAIDKAIENQLLEGGNATKETKPEDTQETKSNDETQYSVRDAGETITRTKEAVKAEMKEAFKTASNVLEDGDRLTFTMPNGQKITVDVRNGIAVTDEELAQAKKDHDIDGNVVVEGYAQTHGKDAYIAVAQGSREGTGFHEAYHIAEKSVLTDKEKAAITKAIPDAEQRADKYAEWVEARKNGRGTAWGKLFQKIKDFAAKMKKIFTGAETVNDVFRQIESGRVWERNVREQGTKQSNQPLYQAKHIVSTFADKINLNRFVNAVLTHNEKSLIMHLGKVDADEAVAIKEATGYDVSNYEHVWRSNDVRHAQKRHGIDTETASDQIGLSPEEMVDALKVISAPDKIERGSINKEGPSIRYIKADNNGQLTIVEVVRSKRKTLDIKTMWKKRAEKLHGDYALQDTSETALDATSSTTENVAHNTDNVNGEKHYSIRKPKDAADEAQEKAEQAAEDTAVTMKDILAAARKILPIYTRSKIHYNSRATYRYDEHGRAGFVPSNYTLGDIGASIALHLDHVAQLKGANVELTNDVLDELEIEQRAAKKYKQEAPKAMTPVEARREGVKEFGRIYFQDPARAKEKYPKYYDIFEKTLDGMPEEKAAVEKILELEAQRAAQNPLLLATAGLSLADDRKKPKTVKERLNTAWARFYRTMVDETDPLRQITKCIEMELGKKLADEKDPHKRAVMCNSVAEGRASMLLFADNKAANLAYLNKIYKGAIRDKVTFEDVLNTLRKVRTEDIKKAAAKDVETYFGMYLVAQRTEEIVKTHKNYVRPEGYSHENCLRIIAEAPEAIRKAAQLYWKYNRNLVNIMEAEGLISEKQAAGLRKYEKYCPMYRDMSEHRTFDDELPTITAGRGFINQSSGIKKLKGGSILAVINPIDSMVSMTTALIARCERNDVAKVMVQSAEDHPGLGRIIVKDPSLFRADASKCAFTVMIAGKKTVYRTTPELYQALQEMSTNSAAFLTNVFGKFTDALRFGATNTPSFMVRNFIRDTLSASVNARYGKFVPIVDSIRGMKALKGDADFRAKFYGQGVPMDTYIRRDIRGAKQYKDKVQKSLKRYPLGIRQLMALSRSLVHKYNDVGEALEQGARAGAMLNALKAGASDFEAGQEARDVTVNFSRHGSFGKKVNRYVPFFNASIQGTDKVIRTFLENPKRASLATCLYIILPTIILWAINHDDDWYKELDDNTKYTNWAVHIPGTDYHWLIPKPQEVGIGFGSGVEAVLNQMLNEDPHAMKAWARQFAEVVTPGIIMTALRPVLEWRYNYSEWTGRKLVPERLSKLPPEQQYTTATSELAKLMSQFAGKYVGLSPIAIDNFFSGWFGSLGRMSANALNKPIDAIRGSSRPPEPARYWYESPFIGSFARQDGQNSVYVERFYQLAEDMEMDYKRSDSYAKNKGKKGAPIPASLKAAQTCMKTMTKINKDIRSIKDDPKMDPETKRKRIDAAYTKMRTYAKKFVTQFDK